MIKISIVEVDKSVILFLAIDMSSSDVVGKCAFKVRKNNSIRYQDAFIEKINRGKGIYKQLFNTKNLDLSKISKEVLRQQNHQSNFSTQKNLY